MITNDQFDLFKKEFEYIVDTYKKKYSIKPVYDYKSYEQLLARRFKAVARDLSALIEEAYNMISIDNKIGRPAKINEKQKLSILLLKEIFHLSNRRMSNFLSFFKLLTGIEISYKTVERTYSDPILIMMMHNIFVIIIKRKNITTTDITGDGTGYSLSITRHYRTLREREGDKIKEYPVKMKEKKKQFAYSFAIMDLDTKLYVGYGTSMRSERDAYNKAMIMLKEVGLKINSARLDQYYSGQSITGDYPEDATIYIIPKKNATIQGPVKWKEMIKYLMEDPYKYLKEYFRRENSETGFSVDKREFGWDISQRREDRISTAQICIGTLHNIFLMGE